MFIAVYKYCELLQCSFICVSGTSYTGRGEAAWSVPSEAKLLSGSGTGSMLPNQFKNVTPYDQQMLMDVMRGGPVEERCVQSNHFTHGYTANAAQRDAGYGSVETLPSTFIAGTGSHLLDTARNVDRSFGAASLSSPAAHSRRDYVSGYSPMSASTPAVAVASSVVQDVSHMPAHKWGSTGVPATSGPRSRNLPSLNWQNFYQQADSQLTATAGSGYFMATPQTTSFSPLQTSMQYSAAGSVATTTLDVSSPLHSPYSPSLGKTYSEAPGGDALQLPLHMQPHYLENLLQLHYLLLASNKLLAPRYSSPRYPPSLGAPRFDSYISGSAAPAARPTVFDVNRLSSSPAGFQHGFTPARFPRSALNRDLQEERCCSVY